PVADVRLVPDLPIPGLNLSAAIFFDAVFRPLEDEFRPLRVIFRWMGPAGVYFVVARAWRPPVLIRLRPARKILWHETNLHVRPHAAFKIRIEDAVENRPVVKRIALRALAVGARGAPLQRRCAVAGGQQIVRAKVNLFRSKLAKFREQLFAMLHIGVVRLVRAEEAPDGLQLAFRLRGVHTDADAKGIGREDGRGHRDDRRSAGNAYKPAPRGSRRGP